MRRWGWMVAAALWLTAPPALPVEPLNTQDPPRQFNWLPRTINPDKTVQEEGPRPTVQPLSAKPARYQDWLDPSERLVVVGTPGEERAYPLRVLAAYRVLMDHDSRGPFVVSYCVPCDWVRVLRLPPQVTAVGWSGLWSWHGVDPAQAYDPLYMDPLFYDLGTKSLFSHKTATAVAGPLEGLVLEEVPHHWTRAAWVEDRSPNLPVWGPDGEGLMFLDLTLEPRMMHDLAGGPFLLLKDAPLYRQNKAAKPLDTPTGGGWRRIVDQSTFRHHMEGRVWPQTLPAYPHLDAIEKVLGFTVDGTPVALPLSALLRQRDDPLSFSVADRAVTVLPPADGLNAAVTVDGRPVPAWWVRFGAWQAGQGWVALPLEATRTDGTH